MNSLATLTEPGHTAAAPSQGPPVRVVVLTASVGAGHDGPAREIARRLIAAGHQADVVDLVDLAPAGTGRMLRNAFHAQLAWAPASWGRLYDATNRAAGTRRSGLATLVRPLARPLARIIAGGPAAPAAAVVSTYPLAGHAVAAARRLAPVSVPLISYVTDPAAHASWVVPGTDLYLTGWATTAVQLWRLRPCTGPCHQPVGTQRISPAGRSGGHLGCSLPVGPAAGTVGARHVRIVGGWRRGGHGGRSAGRGRPIARWWSADATSGSAAGWPGDRVSPLWVGCPTWPA